MRLREKSGAPKRELADAHFLLARALWDASFDDTPDRARAQMLATQARDAYRAATTEAEALGEVEAWLDEHGGAR